MPLVTGLTRIAAIIDSGLAAGGKYCIKSGGRMFPARKNRREYQAGTGNRPID
jgi:hypothetical protein